MSPLRGRLDAVAFSVVQPPNLLRGGGTADLADAASALLQHQAHLADAIGRHVPRGGRGADPGAWHRLCRARWWGYARAPDGLQGGRHGLATGVRCGAGRTDVTGGGPDTCRVACGRRDMGYPRAPQDPVVLPQPGFPSR